MKKNNDTAPGGTLPNSTALVGIGGKRIILITTVVIFLVAIGLLAASVTLVNRHKQNVQSSKTVTLNATQAERELKNNKILNYSQKNSASMVVASQYLSEKKYGAALRVAKTHESDAQTKESAYCGIEIAVYEAQKDRTGLKNAATQCLKILKQKQLTDPYEKGVQLYSEALMYKYIGDTANEKLTNTAFIDLVESNKLTTTEEFGPIYSKIKAEK